MPPPPLRSSLASPAQVRGIGVRDRGGDATELLAVGSGVSATIQLPSISIERTSLPSSDAP
jgi:hypothetical protein